MATKTRLYEFPRVDEAISSAFRLKLHSSTRADVEIYGPDDRRADDLIGKDAALRKDLTSICEKAVAKYRDELGKHLSEQEKAAGKLTGEARDRFASGSIGMWVKFRATAFERLESAVSAETKKRWAKAAAGNGALKGVRFDAIVMPIDLQFYLQRQSAAERKEEAQPEGGRVRLADAQKPMTALEKDLKETVAFMQEIPGRVKSANATLDALQKDYDAGPRESQKDNPVTQGDEEPDEDALDATLFAKHGPKILAAWAGAGMIDASLLRAASGASIGLKSLPPAIKLITAASNEGYAETDLNKKLAKKAAALTECARLLASAESEAKIARNVLADSYAALSALKDNKSAALGLIAKARLDLKVPTDKLASALKLLEDNALA